MLNGVWTAHDATITRNVTQTACGSPGSASTARQLVSPDAWISPIPSHVVKLSASTPMTGTTAKTTKNNRAGAASHGRIVPPPRDFSPLVTLDEDRSVWSRTCGWLASRSPEVAV